MKQLLFLFALLYVIASVVVVEAQTSKPSCKIRGKNPPKGGCDQWNRADCCKAGKFYAAYKCAPPILMRTKAVITINSFEKGGDGGERVRVWWPCQFNTRKRCHKFITVHGNGRSIKAMVVDECNSAQGCDSDHDFQPPCPNNVVDASKAVWKALGVHENNERWGNMEVTRSDA